MTKRLLILALATLPALSAPAWGQSPADERRWEEAQRRFDAEVAAYQRERDRYMSVRRTGYRDGPRDYGRRDDFSTDYDAARYYRAGPNYQERVLSADDRVYRGNDGRYYCRRSDGTTGLIVGAAAGGLFGNVIAGRRSSTVGTILGAIAGGAVGASVDRNQVRCR